MCKPQPGDQFNAWTLVSRFYLENGRQAGWNCVCECGKDKLIKNIATVINGKSTSCGCRRKKLLQENNPMFRADVVEKVRQAMIDDPNRPIIIARATKAAWTDEVRVKREQTNLDRYGGVVPTKSDVVKAKMAETNINRYGGVAPASDSNVVKRMQETNQIRYGVTNWMKDKSNAAQVAQSISKTRRAQGVQTLSDGTTLVDACVKNHLLPTSARNIMRKYGMQALEAWIASDIHTQSALELMAYNEFNQAGLNVETYNKMVPEFKEANFRFKPDLITYTKSGAPIYIDIDGLYYHSEMQQSNKQYHMQKYQIYAKHNIRYLQIREDELRGNSLDIVKSIIANLKGSSNKIYARKTDARDVSHEDAVQFLQNNHLMGSMNATRNIGLYYDNELMMLLCYRVSAGIVELSRVAAKRGQSIVGGLSKLLSRIDTTNCTHIKSFVDNRYADGHSLLALGFKLESSTLGWQWTDGGFTYNRLICTANMDDRGLSEREHAEEMKLYKIYDAGQSKFVKKIP